MPRHPPYALNNLTNTQNPTLDKKPAHPAPKGEPCRQKMLASTVQFSTNKQPPTPQPAPPARPNGRRCGTRDGPAPEKAPDTPPGGAPGPAPSGPNSVPTTTTRTLRPRSTPRPVTRTDGAVLGAGEHTGGRTGQRSTLEHHPDNPRRIGMTHRLRPGMALHHQPAAGGEVL